MMPFICTACGTEYPPSPAPPAACAICEEERQYVPVTGQAWTTLEALAATRRNAYRHYEPGLIGIGTEPAFAIGQRALLIQTPEGNVLWDCIAFLDEATVAIITALGGVQAIAISHPHFYTTNREWSRRFGAPVHLHAADRAWVQHAHEGLSFWEGPSRALFGGLTLVRAGGHFPGGTVLHWAGGAERRGVVCSGDILTVTTDRRWLSFMRSYPNWIPCSASEVEGIAAALRPYAFERVYGHYFDRVIAEDGRGIFDRSVRRYLDNLNGTARPTRA